MYGGYGFDKCKFDSFKSFGCGYGGYGGGYGCGFFDPWRKFSGRFKHFSRCKSWC
ncbi:hypothetical protein [Methanosarcina sp.]|uniref:hypothetical protein n=1 Tax=Methanosarcina sp. TaxID=2213 RepID=UPI002AB953A3|nr:hypothetical protein [Methanosarcina sp.]MDY9925782.1 hypothetical protein [Methanosarcina sp.]